MERGKAGNFARSRLSAGRFGSRLKGGCGQNWPPYSVKLLYRFCRVRARFDRLIAIDQRVSVRGRVVIGVQLAHHIVNYFLAVSSSEVPLHAT